MQRFKSAEEALRCRCRDAGMQGCRGAEVKVQSCRGAEVQSFNGAEEVQRRCRGGGARVQGAEVKVQT